MAKHSKAIDLASKGVEISSGPWYPSFDIPDAFIPADVGETKLMLIRGRITGVRTVPTKSGKTKGRRRSKGAIRASQKSTQPTKSGSARARKAASMPIVAPCTLIAINRPSPTSPRVAKDSISRQYSGLAQE